MREIKFRAWGVDFKEMFYKVGIIDGSHYINFDGKGHKRTGFDEVGNSDEIIFMQYTGLKDKNGVEIYEGDLLVGGKVHSLATNFKITNYEPVPVHFESGMFKVGGLSLCTFNNQTEIVGNIYENPELLEGEESMSKERLEEMNKKVVGLTDGEDFADLVQMDVDTYAWFYERVQELEEFKRKAEELYKNTHLNAKKSIEEKEKLINRVRELENKLLHTKGKYIGFKDECKKELSHLIEENKRYREALWNINIKLQYLFTEVWDMDQRKLQGEFYKMSEIILSELEGDE